MKITKLGHCALIIEHEGVKLLTDPGSFTVEAQERVMGLDAILITHEHQDHLHIESVEKLMKQNPDARIISNGAVVKILADKRINVVIVGDGQSTSVKGIAIEGFGKDHAPIYETMGLVENTGYMVGGRFYFPGDNFHDPQRSIDVLALPVAGPWMKLSMAIDFAKEVKAKRAFGVHDGMVQPAFRNAASRWIAPFVTETEFVELKDGETREF
jgi:L-ascorbate metabolism protein UlaG (beta-lactamase superfamily)